MMCEAISPVAARAAAPSPCPAAVTANTASSVSPISGPTKPGSEPPLVEICTPSQLAAAVADAGTATAWADGPVTAKAPAAATAAQSAAAVSLDRLALSGNDTCTPP